MNASNIDWRVRDQAAYLQGVRLERATFVSTPTWDHEHCEFCYAKFADASLIPDALREGYSTVDRYYWVCTSCFDDFREQFDWALHES